MKRVYAPSSDIYIYIYVSMRKSRCWRINIVALRIGSLRIVVQGKRMQDFILLRTKKLKYFAKYRYV